MRRGAQAPELRLLVVDRTKKALADHPAVLLTAESWMAQLDAALADASDVDLLAKLEKLSTSDLYLAAALARHDPGALGVFEERLMPNVDRALRSFRLDRDDNEELRQQARIRLLMPSAERPPRVAMYRGSGSLAGYVRAVAARLALDAKRSSPPATDLRDLPPALLASTPELARLRSEDRQEFVSLLRHAFFRLQPEQRTILRLHHLDGMTATAVAKAFGVHPTTMMRRLASARKHLLADFESLASDRRLSTEDLVGALASQFDTSLRGVFASARSLADS